MTEPTSSPDGGAPDREPTPLWAWLIYAVLAFAAYSWVADRWPSGDDERPTTVVIPAPPRGVTCSPNYSSCLPIVLDLNCDDVAGSVLVLGQDVYGLDGDGDGIGCD